MIVVNRPHTEPYFNIAVEEYILKNFDNDCFMLWQNEPSIIVGKHQNTLAEINYKFVKKNNIPVVRRISGGGTVFHDLGNLNFSFIKKGEKGKLVDFKKFTDPIIEVLNDLGIPAQFEGKNDLRVFGLKISGNAEHIYKNKVLHHGTLLFSSDLSYLRNALKSKHDRFQDIAVQSVRSKVSNISEYLNKQISLSEFKETIIHHIVDTNKDIRFYSLTNEDIEAINQLVNKKYITWKWNFGYSPKYIFETSIKIRSRTLDLNIEVENGKIINIDSIDKIITKQLMSILLGRQHDFKTIQNHVQENKSLFEEHGISLENILKSLF